MNLRKLTRRRIKDEFAVAPSSFMVRRLVNNLESSCEMIKTYFPHNSTESEFMGNLEDMVAYFNKYK